MPSGTVGIRPTPYTIVESQLALPMPSGTVGIRPTPSAIVESQLALPMPSGTVGIRPTPSAIVESELGLPMPSGTVVIRPTPYAIVESQLGLPMPSGRRSRLFCERQRSVRLVRPAISSGMNSSTFSDTSSCVSFFRFPISYNNKHAHIVIVLFVYWYLIKQQTSISCNGVLRVSPATRI